MCGIAGFSSLSNEIGRNDIDFILKKIAHRGPDDDGFFLDNGNKLCLIHSRLSIIDLSSLGHQPMTKENITIVFNGEIYNYKKIREDLEDQGVKFDSHSDTEVLLRLYISLNYDLAQTLSKIQGMFALAIWDKVHEKLLLARDSFGVKPLYLFKSDKFLAFSSEIKALSSLYIDKSSKEVNIKALQKYLKFLWCPGNETPFIKINKVSPGTIVEIKNGSIIDQKSWYKPVIQREFKKNLSSTDAIKGTEKYLREAVHSQLISDVPVGAFLSGGLDSSAIVAFAREIIPDIQCFSIRSNTDDSEGFLSDLPYAREVSKYLKVPLEIVDLQPDSIVSCIQEMVYQLDEPLADPAALNVFFISKLAKEMEIKVLLSGTGGDDIFSGYRRHVALNIQGFYDWIPKLIIKGLLNFSENFNPNVAFIRRLKRFLGVLQLDNEDRLLNYFSWITNDQVAKLLSGDFENQIKAIETDLPMKQYIDTFPNNCSDLDQMLALEQRFFLADHNLTYTDKMSMANGIEVRVPFLDENLVSFAGRIPDKFKQNGNISKWVLKKAMEPYLPRNVIHRPKTGFSLPLRGWIKDELQDFVYEILSEENLKSRGIYNTKNVIDLIENNRKGKIDATYTIFSLLVIEIWFNKFLDDDRQLFSK